MRYLLEFSFNGKNYFGYQIQPKEISVQEVVEGALSTLLREEIKIIGAGRTDTGVHARKMFAHFDYDGEVSSSLTDRLNRFLPPDIAIREIYQVADDFHARFDATYRTYNYHISLQKNPFALDSSYEFYTRSLDLEKMNEAAKRLFDYSDFEAFSRKGSDNKTSICTIYKASWRREGEELIFEISADRFLRNMVRAVVGTLLEVGLGKLSTDGFTQIIESKSRAKAGTSAPAKGLFLVDVGYGDQKLMPLKGKG